MPNEVEVRSRRRRILLMVMASAFLIWQVVSMDFFERVAGGNDKLAGLLGAAAALIWAGGLVMVVATGKIASSSTSAGVRSALEDELVRSNRSKAFIVGYIAALAAAGIVFVVSLLQPVTGADAARLILVVAVVTPMYAFVVLERINA